MLRFILALIFATFATAAIAQPATTKPNVSNTLAQCLANVPIVGNGAGTSPICNPGGALTGAATATYTVAGSCTLADISGASLTFTGTSCEWNRIGNIVFIHGALTYPSTASGAAAEVSITGPGVNFLAGNTCYITSANVATAARLFNNVGAISFFFINTAQATITNAAMSTGSATFACMYPAT